MHDKAGYEDLLKWKDWFDSLGIASELVLTDKGYALYRLGLAED